MLSKIKDFFVTGWKQIVVGVMCGVLVIGLPLYGCGYITGCQHGKTNATQSK